MAKKKKPASKPKKKDRPPRGGSEPKAPKEPRKPKPGEQLALIEVTPEGHEELLDTLREYKDVVTQRVSLSNREGELKQRALAQAKELDIQRNKDGGFDFTIDGMHVSVTPQDEKISIKSAAKKRDDEMAGAEA